MGTVSTLPAFLDAFRAKLLLRSELAGVNIYTGPVDDLSIGEEALVFAVDETEGELEYKTLPHAEAFESYDVEGRIWIVVAGAGETAIKAARDRAFVLFAEVASELKADNVSTAGTVTALGVSDARITEWTLKQIVVDGGRDARITFNVEVRAEFTPA